MATIREPIKYCLSWRRRKSKTRNFLKRGMNKLYRQAWKQKQQCLYKHPYKGYP